MDKDTLIRWVEARRRVLIDPDELIGLLKQLPTPPAARTDIRAVEGFLDRLRLRMAYEPVSDRWESEWWDAAQTELQVMKSRFIAAGGDEATPAKPSNPSPIHTHECLAAWKTGIALDCTCDAPIQGDGAYSDRDHAFTPWQKDPKICGLCGKGHGDGAQEGEWVRCQKHDNSFKAVDACQFCRVERAQKRGAS